MTTNGAQMRLVYEYIHTNTGQWVTNTSSWVDANLGQLTAFKESVNKTINRADRRNYHIEYRRFSVQVHQIEVGASWMTFAAIIENGDPAPAEQWVCVDGNPDNGFTLIGTFHDQGAASNWGRANGSGEFWSMKLERP